MASFFYLNTVCSLTLTNLARNFAFSKNQLWALLTSLFTGCFPCHKFMLSFISFLYPICVYSVVTVVISQAGFLFILSLYSFLKYNRNYIIQLLKILLDFNSEYVLISVKIPLLSCKFYRSYFKFPHVGDFF